MLLRKITSADIPSSEITPQPAFEKFNRDRRRFLAGAAAAIGAAAVAATKIPSILDPEIIFCDEPSAGLDPVVAAELDDTLLRFRDVLGITIVIVSHELESIRALADRAIMFGHGKMLASGTLSELEHSQNEEVYHYFHARSA